MAKKNSAAFRRQCAKFFKAARERPIAFANAVSLALFTGFVRKSPVRTGRFRGNWNAQPDPSPIISNDVDLSGDATIERGKAAIKAILATQPRVFLLNHLPYSIPLEYGHSRKQAPHGMVRVALAEVTTIIQEAAAEVKKS